MKSNFVVSTYRDIWLPNAKRLFAVDPYIAHVLEREKCFAEYDEVQVAPPSRATREEFLRDHEFVDRKFHQYSDILAHRLDKLHGSSHGVHFWRKAFSLSILRHVSLCYDLFKPCETYLNPMLHDCRVLDQESYRTPVDFDEHRQMFQNTDLGQEQLFSVYCGLFHPGQFASWRRSTPSPKPNTKSLRPPSRGLWQQLNPRRVAHKVVGRFLRTLRTLRTRSPKVGIIDCSFSPEHRDRLVAESAGRIQTIPLPTMPLSGSAPQWRLRDQLVQDEPGFDRFDKFVFACLRHGMPKMFVEDFPHVYARLNSHFNRYPDLRWVVCEWWIGQTHSALALAVLQQRDVKHIYNEHNYLSHFFVGSNLKYLAPLVDEFVSLGWEDSSIPNLIRGASLYPWIEKGDESVKEHDILFVSAPALMHMPEINTCYGESGAYRAIAFIDMNQRFLARLGEETLSKLYIRSYPLRLMREWLIWDQSVTLAPYLNTVKVYDDDSPISARSLMQRSRLVIVNYLSTAYLESIIANIPSIVIWNQDTYLLTEKYMGVFDALIEAGICQTNPDDAADFVNRIKDNPERWWHSSEVQRGRAAFLNANIGNPEVMIQHLLAKAN